MPVDIGCKILLLTKQVITKRENLLRTEARSSLNWVVPVTIIKKYQSLSNIAEDYRCNDGKKFRKLKYLVNPSPNKCKAVKLPTI